jgi:drug/metabolite transporter (DMT)-like permease
MIIAPLLWSIAGVVTRSLSPELQAQGRFEITFWRSLFAAICVGGYLAVVRHDFGGALRRAGRAGLISGCMWATMFICFMLALTLTSTANTLIVLAVAPLLTALLARAVLKRRYPVRGSRSIAMAGTDGCLPAVCASNRPPACCMPIAAGTPLAPPSTSSCQAQRHVVDLIPAVFLGGAISAAPVLPLAWPSFATPSDLPLLAVLGIFQQGSSMLLVVAARSPSATELSPLALLEVLLGPLWAWLGAGEVPAASTVSGGALVLSALVVNELAAARQRAAAAAR